MQSPVPLTWIGHRPNCRKQLVRAAPLISHNAHVAGVNMAIFACNTRILKDLETHALSVMHLQRCPTCRKRHWAVTVAGSFHASLIIARSIMTKRALTAGNKRRWKTVWPQHHMLGIVAENSMLQALWKQLLALQRASFRLTGRNDSR